MNDVDMDLKTKYIDITQLPVAEDENSVLTYEHFERLREELDKPNRRYEFEGDWGESLLKQFMGIDWASGADITRVFGIPSEYLYDDAKRVGIPYNTGYCTPSRNNILTFSFNSGA